MSTHYLPSVLRSQTKARPLRTGVGGDLPRWFYDDIKSIDPNLYFVYHDWVVIYDNIMNAYDNEERFPIQEYWGRECFGFPLKSREHDGPKPEDKWHLWRLCWPYGWAHVTSVEAKQEEYLVLLTRRLYKQAIVSDRYGQKEYAKMTLKEQSDAQAKAQADADSLYEDVQKENSWLVNSAMENFKSGKTAPSNPEKDVIMSYPGQKNRTKIVRPIHDTEGGLYLPDEWKS